MSRRRPRPGPFPWHMAERYDAHGGAWWIVSENPGPIALVVKVEQDERAARPNAAFICAAPDMAALLRALVDGYDDHRRGEDGGNFQGDLAALVKDARALLTRTRYPRRTTA